MKSTSLTTIPEHSLYVEEPSKPFTNDPIANSMNQNSTTEAEKRSYVDVLSILKEGGILDTCEKSFPTSKEKKKENNFYKPNFNHIWNKTNEYKPAIDADSASFKIKETIFKLFGENSTKEILPSVDALMELFFP